MSNETERTVDLSVEAPGTPEEVWAAIATGPGISSWFAVCEVEGRVGGAITTDYGEHGKDTAHITDWEPPHRFRGQAAFGDGVLAHEWLLEARAGGTCLVRVVASGFGTGDDWDAVYDGLATGWRIFLENLRLHVTHFLGQRARMLHEVAPMPDATKEGAWASLCEALGVDAGLREGERFETSGDAVPALAGTVETRLPGVYLFTIDTPSPGTGFVSAERFGEQIILHVALYFYGDAAAVDNARQRWATWMAAQFPAPASVD
jgi:uncharacterized protein YndB with AHSA1/START domain